MHAVGSTLGIVDPAEGFRHFRLQRYAPCATLAPYVESYWIVRWDLPIGTTFRQEVLPHPSFNLSVEPSLTAVHGIGTKRFVATLAGSGRVVAAKFRAGAFSAFVDRPLTTLVARIVPLAELSGETIAARLTTRVQAETDDEPAAREIERFLLARELRVDPGIAIAVALVDRARTDRDITRASHLATVGGFSVRSLHRLFERCVGVSPKWVIRRARVHEAAERVAGGARLDWAALAQELGYHDQSHLIHDFKDEMGETPAAYAARCRASALSADFASNDGDSEKLEGIFPTKRRSSSGGPAGLARSEPGDVLAKKTERFR